MKKSELYHLAQIAVILAPCITPERKCEILHVLMMDEDLEKFSEEREAKKALAALLDNETVANAE